MMAYPEVPWYWYAAIGIISFVFGVIGIEISPTQLPVWCFVVSLVIAAILIIPVGMIRAITNQTIALQILAELIVGYIIATGCPGRM